MRHLIQVGLLAVLPLVTLPGCMQLDVTVRLESDGRGTVIEKLSYSKKVLDFESDTSSTTGIKALLSKEAAEKRADSMGKGMKLVSHKLAETEDGGLEAVSKYEIPDLNDARLIYPYLAMPDAEKKQLKLTVYPSYFSAGWDRFNQDQPGWMGVHVGSDVYGHQPKPAPPLSPAKEQELRKLIPVFRDLLRGFKIKMTFEGYGAIRCGGWMSWTSGDSRGSPLLSSNYFELLEFSDQNLDEEGRPILENDETMLALLRGDVASSRLMGLSERFWEKHRVPIYRPVGRWGAIYMLPSKYHYTKYFDGKPLEMLLDRKTDGQDRWIRKRDE